MTIIDAHAHIGSWPNVKTSEDEICYSMEHYRIAYSLISDADASEYAAQRTPLKNEKNTLDSLKAVLRFVRKYPDELGALVWIRPHKEKCTPELEAFIEKNLRYIHGLKFHPYCSRLRVNDPKLVPYLEMAKRLHLPILVHTAADKYSDVAFLKEVCDHYPDLKFVAAHMQLCSDNKAALAAMKTTPNLYADTAWVDMKMAKKALLSCGEDRVLFGTDSPIDGPATLDNPIYQGYFKNKCHLPGHLYANLMWRNAAKLFSIELKGKK